MDKKTVPNEIMLEDAAQLMAEGREVSFTPLGNSMLPFIRGGRDSVTLIANHNVKVGDMALVRIGGRYVLHRVIKADEKVLTLMGDGNIRGTEKCTRDDVLGTVVAIERNGRTIKPGNGRWWRLLKPFRRYILAIYRRVI